MRKTKTHKRWLVQKMHSELGCHGFCCVDTRRSRTEWYTDKDHIEQLPQRITRDMTDCGSRTYPSDEIVNRARLSDLATTAKRARRR